VIFHQEDKLIKFNLEQLIKLDYILK
jgi:hypothetical protein